MTLKMRIFTVREWVGAGGLSSYDLRGGYWMFPPGKGVNLPLILRDFSSLLSGALGTRTHPLLKTDLANWSE